MSIGSDGRQANGDSTRPSLSGDGRLVVFESTASNLVPGDTNFSPEIFVHDRSTGVTERVSLAADGERVNVGPGAVRPTGRAWGQASVAAPSSVPTSARTAGTSPSTPSRPTSSQVTPTPAPSFPARRSPNGAQANDASTDPAISADGRAVEFLSTASNLAVGDTGTCDFPLFTGHPGQCPDIYLSRR